MRTLTTLAIVMLAACNVAEGSFRFAIENDNGNSCMTAEVGGEPVDFQVVAYYEGFIDGASFEFRITGLPANWIVASTVNPTASIALGDPFGAGVNIGFPVCNPGENSRVVLFNVVVVPTTAATASFHLEAHSIPSNANFMCPLIWACFAFSGACFPTGLIGTVHSDGESCVVSVQEETWATVKLLYQ